MSELPGPDSKHPARLASWHSADAVARGDKQAWLDNFADDAIVEDPIGKSLIDPTGEGFRGKEAISGFWDSNIEKMRPMFSLQHSICAGSECANVGTLTIQFENGMISQLFGVFTYKVNDEGKVTALRTFWEGEDLRMYPPIAERGS
ncbi:MAG: nuclear transport factor 2 family protein [Myxococcota bacterium]|jgi:ketosteroid isomerase-like protein|nr:nuclear transport factor 2 family protein [Myxococcota bacterium]